MRFLPTKTIESSYFLPKISSFILSKWSFLKLLGTEELFLRVELKKTLIPVYKTFIYFNLSTILPILIRCSIFVFLAIFLRVVFFLTYSEIFLELYLLLRRRFKIPEPRTLFVNFLMTPRLLSFSPFFISTFIAI